MTIEIEWKCPKCGAEANECSKKGGEKHQHCSGFICECDPRDVPESESKDHGLAFSNPCTQANCYCCGWGGTVPKKPNGLQAWEKKALEAGWKMPANRKKELGL
jgi:hypothetical protein